MYTASCLCGGVQFNLHGEIQQIFVCHCQQCQKAQGSAFAAIAVVKTQDLEIVQGSELLGEYYATEIKKRVFCQRCASPLYSARLDLKHLVRIRVGIINEKLNAQIHSHAYTESKAAWFEMSDQQAQFPAAIALESSSSDRL